MSRKSRNLEGQTGTDVAVLEEQVVPDGLDDDLAHVRGEMETVVAALLRRPDMQGGDGEVMATRVVATLNGAVAGKPALSSAIHGALAQRWESMDRLGAVAGTDSVMQVVRRQLIAAANPRPEGAKVVTTSAATSEMKEPVAAAVDENPALTRLMGYIDELQAPDDAKAALRRDVGGLGKQLKDSRVATTARKSIVKTAKKFPGNEALLAKLG